MLSKLPVPYDLCIGVPISCLCTFHWLTPTCNNQMWKSYIGAFNQEKALVGGFSVIVKSSRMFVWSSILQSTANTLTDGGWLQWSAFLSRSVMTPPTLLQTQAPETITQRSTIMLVCLSDVDMYFYCISFMQKHILLTQSRFNNH